MAEQPLEDRKLYLQQSTPGARRPQARESLPRNFLSQGSFFARLPSHALPVPLGLVVANVVCSGRKAAARPTSMTITASIAVSRLEYQDDYAAKTRGSYTSKPLGPLCPLDLHSSVNKRSMGRSLAIIMLAVRDWTLALMQVFFVETYFETNQ